VEWHPGETHDRFRGGHRGYLRLPAPVLHHREIVLAKREGWVTVRDALEGQGVHRLVWRFHLDPAVEPVPDAEGWRLRAGGREAWLFVVERPAGVEGALDPGWVSPSYGVVVETRVVRLEATLALPVEVVCLFADRWLSPAARAGAAGRGRSA
jgi:hypothetical protein